MRVFKPVSCTTCPTIYVPTGPSPKFCDDCRGFKKTAVDYKYKYQIAWKRRMKDELLEAYGNKCNCCGETERAFLTLDHIGGGGGADRRLRGTGGKLYSKIKNEGYPKDKYQLLCMNCNFAEGIRGGCPHRLRKEGAYLNGNLTKCA